MYRVSAVVFTLLVALSAAAAEPPAAELRPGDRVEREISGTTVDSYRVALAAGECANLTVEQKGIDVIVRVVGPDGKLESEIDNESRPEGVERATIVADTAAEYQVTTKPRYARTVPGRYAIVLGDVHPATDSDRDRYQAVVLSTRALYAAGQSKLDQGLDDAEKAVEVGERGYGADAAPVGALLLRRGFLERALGRNPKARNTFEEARKVSATALGDDDPQTALAVEGIGLTYLSESDYANAEPLFRQALAAFEKTLGGDHPRLLECLLDLSVVHENLADRKAAIADLERARRIGEKDLAPDDFQLAAVAGNLGTNYRELGDYERAEPLLRRCLAIVEKRFGPDHYFVATPLRELAIIDRERKQLDSALDLLWRAEAAQEKGIGLRHPQTASTLLTIADIYDAQGETAKALELQQEAMRILESVAGPYQESMLNALSGLVRTYAAEGNAACALEYQARAAGILEKDLELNLAIGSERQKLAYAESAGAQTDRTLSLQANDAGDDAAAELALTVVLQRKGRVLDAMTDTFAAVRQELNADDRQLLEQLRGATTELAKVALNGPGKTSPREYRGRLAKLEGEKEKLEQQISARSAVFRAETTPVTVAAIRAAIPPDAALVEFSVYRPYDPRAATEAEMYGAPRYIAYVLRQRGGIGWRDLGDARSIDRTVAEWRAALRDPNDSRAIELARTLDRRIMQPLRPLLRGATHLLISPDGQLDLIPFEALLDASGRYLVERTLVTYLTSGRDLLRMEFEAPSRGPAVIVADPSFGVPAVAAVKLAGLPLPRRSVTAADDFSHVYFAPLVGTKDEARSIHALFPDARVLSGKEATKEALRQLHAPRILHIATHGFFLGFPDDDRRELRSANAAAPADNPLLRSGLALAGANLVSSGNEDGVLTALEASTLDLRGTKLVTLSACDSGVGEVRNREGVYGLRRAFLLAGAESLVMSLWSVSDYTTRLMMTSYYSSLRHGRGRGEALRDAQLTMLHGERTGHPFYWASFIQSGDWRGLQ